MRPFVIKSVPHLRGAVSLLGDKSIAHRGIIVSALAPGKTEIENFPPNKDCLSTLNVFRKLGIKIIQKKHRKRGYPVITVFGKGLFGLKEPKGPIFVGDSGTTLRLLLGVLAGQNFSARLTAGRSLCERPMRRVNLPLRMMGAIISSKLKVKSSKLEEFPPITIKGGKLKPITYKMPVASAQVKSAILLAGLYTPGKTMVIESVPTRDHTERMLKLFKTGIKVYENKIVINGGRELISPKKIYIPADLSSASFFLVASTLIPGSQITLKDISLNPSRTGIIRVLKRMGANIKVKGLRAKVQGYEPMGDLIVKSSQLRGTIVKKEEIPSMIDELPILMVAACLAQGKTLLEGISELRVKETDRIRSMSWNLRRMGAKIEVSRADKSEKIIIEGIKHLKGTKVRSFGDHRTAMSMVVAGLLAIGKTQIDDISCINKSSPDFISILNTLIQ
jgi:3-phosphoshikimate 1-carboxyvinyltransferase